MKAVFFLSEESRFRKDPVRKGRAVYELQRRRSQAPGNVGAPSGVPRLAASTLAFLSSHRFVPNFFCPPPAPPPTPIAAGPEPSAGPAAPPGSAIVL